MVNNAGISSSFRRFLRDDLRDFDRVMAVNLFGVVIGTQRAGRHMAEHGGGSIINTSSIGGLTGGGPPIAYRTSKAAIVQFSRMVATDLAEYGVRVNCIAPGHIPTGITSYDLGPTIEAGPAPPAPGHPPRRGRGGALPGRRPLGPDHRHRRPGGRGDGGRAAGAPGHEGRRAHRGHRRLTAVDGDGSPCGRGGRRPHPARCSSHRPPAVADRLLDQPDDPGDPRDRLFVVDPPVDDQSLVAKPRSTARRRRPPPPSAPLRATLRHGGDGTEQGVALAPLASTSVGSSGGRGSLGYWATWSKIWAATVAMSSSRMPASSMPACCSFRCITASRRPRSLPK